MWLCADAIRPHKCFVKLMLPAFVQVDQYNIMIRSGDFMNTSKPAIEAILQAGEYDVLAYSGAWDGVLGAAVSEPLYAALQWPGAMEFRAGARRPYKVTPNDTQVQLLDESVPSC